MQNKLELPPYAIESVNTALRLLLLFRERDVLRVTDVSTELGVARSTAHRLLVTLAFQGFVQQERNSRSYRAGPALMDLSASPAGLREIREAAHPWMVRLSADLNETVNLLILEGSGARFIDGVECERPVRVSARTGTLLPANATAGGKVMLSTLSPEEVDFLTGGHLSKMTSTTITNPQEFREELDDVKRLGYAINRNESLDGLHAVAVCIFNSRGHAVASLAVSVPADRGGNARLRDLIPSLREAADNIGSRLT
ncbi:IclR family transcriptional regulator [Alpinimonas psychrophila]|uniref:DNA-binding IclR family transcriptional regulator n=1 Tax=Alpinimonas psychrophila TaxID=748908 RepID=A0A7W3JVJ1_9MICO|nr:IclR family transcriptional regulator [Alpinimonas psychrophila]MBA8830001.1 DNA-binding IclR family transcriptional regulator [Alpinimonas psychrophila]